MNFLREVDVVVIGGGVIGTAILRELSKYKLKSVLLEKEVDLSLGTTKANSAIIHAGFDAPTNSVKGRTNVRGNALYHELCADLDLDIKWVGSMVVATTDEELETLKTLLERGRANGVPGLELLEPAAVLAREPHLNPELKGALLAPTAGICWPFGIAINFARNAVANGSEVLTNCGVTAIQVENNQVVAVTTTQGSIKTSFVINAAGVHADEVARLAGDASFSISARKGEYILFDKAAAQSMVSSIVFPTPSVKGKGCLVCATTHGNVFIGPNAQEVDDKEDHATSLSGMNEIIGNAKKLMPTLPLRDAITEFSGLRAVSDSGDFIIGASSVGGLIHAAGMQSPGLSAAPAVAEEVVAALGKLTTLEAKPDFQATLPPYRAFASLTREEQEAKIKANPLYGRVICRCETITEGEIVDVIKQSCGATTVDGVKRRTRAGMGRCQGGFCGPRVTQIIARELGIPVTEVLKEGAGSQLFYDKNTQGGQA